LPALTPVTADPLTVQTEGVALVNITAKPEEAVADNTPVLPTVIVGAEPKVIV
jgi:hypothetical protein